MWTHVFVEEDGLSQIVPTQRHILEEILGVVGNFIRVIHPFYALATSLMVCFSPLLYKIRARAVHSYLFEEYMRGKHQFFFEAINSLAVCGS